MLQYYFFESSAWSGERIGHDGLYDCSHGDVVSALVEIPGWAHILIFENTVAGFVLTEDSGVERESAVGAVFDSFAPACSGGIRELADLFMLPNVRGRGLAVEAVRRVIVPGSGIWMIAMFREDVSAQAYWSRALPRLGFRHRMVPDEVDARFRLYAVEAPPSRP